MTEWDPEFPDNWRDHENGHELVLSALVRAYGRHDDEHVIELVDVAGELASYGAFRAAHAIASIGISYALELPLESVLDEYKSATSVTERARGVRTIAPASKVMARILGVTAFIARREGNTDDALVLYRDAATVANDAGEPLLAAQLLQSLGALYHEVGHNDAAREVTSDALERYTRLEDEAGIVGTELNLAEYDAVEHRLRQAHERLLRLEEQVRDLGNPHLSGSWLARSAVLDIANGDVRDGRAKLHRSLRNAERRGDVQLQVAALGHLATSAREDGRRRRATAYAERAFAAAEESSDPLLISDTAHELAIDYAEADRFEEAVSLLRRATEAAVGVHRTRIRADLGAVLLSRALADRGTETSTSDDESEWLREAERVLLGAVAELLEHGDEGWAEPGIRNLRVVWRASKQEEQGAKYLREFSAGQVSPEFAGECFRLSGLLAMDARAESSDALDRLREAARLLSAKNEQRTSFLLEFAGIAEHSYRELDVALALYDDALGELSPTDDPTVYGNALNDSALVAMALYDEKSALERLQTAANIAGERADRVLGSLVELNLGEVLTRMQRPLDARPHFERAAAQAEAFGDDERAAVALASLANTFVNDETASDLSYARALAQRAEEAAVRAGDVDALSRAVSARGSLMFADGDLDGAYALWTRARDISDPHRRPIYEGFLLHTLASQRDGRKFSRQLERFTKAAQRHNAEVLFAEQLWPSANVWLRQGNVDRAAKVLAYSILLASAGRSAKNRAFFDDEVAVASETNIAVMRVLSNAGHLLTLDVIPAELREQLRPMLLKALVNHGVSNEDAAQVVKTVEEFARDDD
ncbi:hypothetical protein PFZ55_40955 [Streptomyces sp. MS2A]|nr:hypothetical protein [Streptomyces sp. MS2A]